MIHESSAKMGPSRKGFARIMVVGREKALILGQRPPSPKGVQCYVGPLAHCGSHCCANCITTGSGRDLPSVARNSVSRGLVPALHNATAAAHYPQHRRQTSLATATLGRRNVHRITLRYTSHQWDVARPHFCYVSPFETTTCDGGAELVTRSRQSSLSPENANADYRFLLPTGAYVEGCRCARAASDPFGTMRSARVTLVQSCALARF